MARCLLVALTLMAGSLALGAENLALGRPYVLAPAPNYDLCTEAGDATQLTDGAHTEGYFWAQPSTVGWMDASPVVITVDLGSDQPVGGVSFSTAARNEAGALWPRAIFLRVSTDGQRWYDAGELVALATAQGTLADPETVPPGHMLRRYSVRELATHGRYVAFVIAPNGKYCFTDEVEVYRGAEALLGQAPEGPVLSDLAEGLDKALAEGAIVQVVMGDAAAIGRDLARSPLGSETRAALQAELLTILRGPLDIPPLAYHEVFPLNEMHGRVLVLGARVWQAAGRPPLQVWTGQRWDPLQPRSAPPPDVPPAAVRVTLMRGEVRSAVLNLTNSLTRPRPLSFSLTGLPVAAGEALRMHEVAWTFSGTDPVAAALPPAERRADGWQVTVPAGATRQVWLMVDGRRLPVGSHGGTVVIREGRGEVARVPLRLRVSPVAMPRRLSLALGGWDYTDGPALYQVTEPLRQSLVRFLHEYDIDAPWASKQVMPFGTHAADGSMTAPPDTTSMDEWLGMWRGSRYYCVFNNFEGADALGPGLPMGTAQWQRAVGEWARFWAAHLGRWGIAPQQFRLLLVDEPRDSATDELTITYAEAIRAAAPEVVIWTDPIWQNPKRANPRLYELATVIAPQRSFWQGDPATHREVFLAQQRAGRKLAFYSCSGPVRGLDPYSYHLLQAWDCFRYDMTEEFFWSFGGGGGMAPWNQIGAENTVFTPQYRLPDGWITSRHMEAIREGRYDYEYLVMLRGSIQAARAAGVDGSLVRRAQRLLDEAPGRVLEASGANGIWWAAPKDRGLADRTRLRVLAMIERLAEP